MRKLTKVRCPICNKVFKFKYRFQNVEGCTFDCKQCDGLLIMQNQTIKDFHKQLHEEFNAWPEDGKGTGVIMCGE